MKDLTSVMRSVPCRRFSKYSPGLIDNDKVRMYEEIMTNDDNLESNLLTSSLLKNVWFTCWYKMN